MQHLWSCIGKERFKHLDATRYETLGEVSKVWPQNLLKFVALASQKMVIPHGLRSCTPSGIAKDQSWSMRDARAYQSNPTLPNLMYIGILHRSQPTYTSACNKTRPLRLYFVYKNIFVNHLMSQPRICKKVLYRMTNSFLKSMHGYNLFSTNITSSAPHWAAKC